MRPKKYKDIEINDIYGDIIILEKIEKSYKNDNHKYFKCKCICNKIFQFNDTRIRKYLVCNHASEDLTNKIFGNIKVLCQDGYDYSHGRKKLKWKYECLLCGKIKSYAGEVIKRGDIQSCGNHMPSGINHHAYNPNIDRHRRDSSDYKKWSKSILKKFNYKCSICNKNYKLVAHHLDGWK